jgi:small membrane protein
MTIIQIVLTICIALIAVYMYLRLRSTLFDLILILLFFGVGVFLVLFPETTNDIANFVGVSKGANLLLYSAIMFLFFLILKLYSRLRRVEQKFTELVRNKSLEEAEEPVKKD